MLEPSPHNGQKRLLRLAACEPIQLQAKQISPAEVLDTPGPLVGIVSSRLGHDPNLHRQVCQFLSRRMMDLRQRHARILVAAGSAIEKLAIRAAELFHIPVVRLIVGKEATSYATTETVLVDCVIQSNDALPRDAVLIGLADQIDAAYVRRGGKIDQALRRRLLALRDSSCRVAVLNELPTAGPELIQSGAIGWYLSDTDQAMESCVKGNTYQPIIDGDTRWMQSDGQWLIHCTRSCLGPWPGQTPKQHQDELLLGHSDGFANPTSRGPLETLMRIVRSGRLVAGAITSAQKYPVVCFSERSLVECLKQRSFRSHVSRWDGEPYGIAVQIDAAKRFGIKPVIYGEKEHRKQLTSEDKFRFQAKGKTHDWTLEREWRYNATIDLTRFAENEVRVFVPEKVEASQLCPIRNWLISVTTT
ncbi:hypothetical protein CA13_08180 [Planctomycetes bacterium CA13]|uniref:Uncharacterized protein n=1 Tax=Novipirellula herctigrandis TaxID=2527986 RepID=A0A5C5YWL2_9BACT|nr:hypothetical protein CA13_08180 [Planctomycetes bacterium CA13]